MKISDFLEIILFTAENTYLRVLPFQSKIVSPRVASFGSVILKSQSRGKTCFAVFSVIFFLPLRIKISENLKILKNYFEKMNLNF